MTEQDTDTAGLTTTEQLRRQLAEMTNERDDAYAELDHARAALNRAGVNGPGAIGDCIDAAAEALARLRTDRERLTGEVAAARALAASRLAELREADQHRATTQAALVAALDRSARLEREADTWRRRLADETAPLRADLRSTTRALREALAERDEARTAVAQTEQLLADAATARIDHRDRIWRPTDAGWSRPPFRPLSTEDLHQQHGPTRTVLLIDVDGHDQAADGQG